ncbi:MAG: hypothetical protein U5R49_27510 [Deltaproteobacteria bacterium]|nr:hypothetical protein [Deltaproteobacteria bacterium]
MNYRVLSAEQIPPGKIVPHLMHRLSNKGLYPEAIPNLIEDILHMVAEGWYFTLEDINRELAQRGWDLGMDPITIELVLSLLEGKGEYEVRCYEMH